MTITKLGRYDIVRVLGKGAMGMVYEARDPNLDRRVAIKTIRVENLSADASADYEARFRTEARSAARLQHPNIVSVYDSERHGDTAYLVMEYVQGDDLKQYLDGGKQYSLEQSVGMVRDLLAALDYAHRQNIVHRDVKPANLLIEASGRVKLTDFGVARIQDSGDATRTKGSMVGTLKYMSPEQVQGLSVDARADLFAAGIVLYQLLTGKRPFDGESEFAIIHQIVSQNPPAPSSIHPQVPAEMDAVVARALAKQREDRFATAHEFALALQQASGQVPDPNVVPPPSGGEFRGAVGTGSGGLGSRAGIGFGTAGRAGESSGSTVTQELELVYWKDIKDTDDSSDVRGFLDRFPDGIYADLARRRLRKLEGSERGEQSATRTTVAALVPSASSVTSEETLYMARPDMPLEPAPVDGAPVAPLAAPPRSRSSQWAWSLAAIAVGGGLGYALFSGSTPPASGPSTLPLAGAASAPVVAPPTSEPATQRSAATSAVLEATSSATAAPPKTAASAVAKPTPATQGATSATLLGPASPTAAAATAKQPADPQPALDNTGPAQACAGRTLFSYQFCVTEQCAKPVFAQHPLCLERLAADRARVKQGADTR